MKLISIGGVALSDYHLAGVASGIVRGLPGPDRSPNTLERTGAPALIAGMRRGARPIPLALYLDPSYASQSEYTRELWLRKFMGKVDFESEAARAIVAQIDTDGDGDLDTTVECLGVAGPWQWSEEAKGILVTFYATSPAWFSQAIAFQAGAGWTDGVFTIDESPEEIPITNSGETVARPLIGICMSSQRVTSTEDVGWTYRQRFEVTNNTDDNWYGELGTIDLGNTLALVSGGKALTSGDDLRVRIEGKELPRTLTNWNTLRTFVHIPLTIEAGETIEYEVIYGNANAGTPDTMSNFAVVDGNYCAIDLTGDTGTATGGTGTTLVDTSKDWPDDYWNGGYAQLLSGTGSASHAKRRILDTSGGDTITIDRAWATGGNPAAGTVYALWKSGVMVNGGQASGAGTTTEVTDSSQVFDTNELRGGKIWNVTQGLGPATITDNTATTIDHGALGSAWANTNLYYIEKPGAHSYNVLRGSDVINTTGQIKHRGMYQLNRRATKSSDLDLDGSQSIGGWGRTTFVDNQDDFAQPSAVLYAPNGYWPVFYGQRRRAISQVLVEERQGDGLSISDPRRFRGIRFSYNIINTNSAAGSTAGIGKFVAGMRETANQTWEWFEEDDQKTALASVAAAYYDLTTTLPQLLGFGGIPQDETAIAPSASASDLLATSIGNRLECFLDPLSITYGTTSGEEAIYDLCGALCTDYIAVITQVAGEVLQFGGPGHHIHLTASDVLWVDCETGAVYLTDGGPISLSGGFVFTKYAPWAMRPLTYTDDTDNDGRPEPKVSASWMPMAVGDQTWRWVEEAVGELELTLQVYPRFLG